MLRGWLSKALMNWLNKYLTENENIGDEGIDCSGEFHVGLPGAGRESVFGEGDSHVIGMKVFSTSDDVSYTDNTAAAASGSGSTYETFNGTTTVGSTDYMGSDSPLCGIKLTNAVLVTPGTGTVAREYWNGSAWVPFTAMVTKADAPYTQLADNLGTFVGSEQVRFGNCNDQVKTTVNGELKYWVRFRITSAITAVGEVEQVKLHTNRFEVNADGFTEYFGDGVYEKDLAMHWHLTEELSGFSPQNSSVIFADLITLVYTSNKLNSGQTSGRGGYIKIPEGLDTSRGIKFDILFRPLTVATGDVLFNLDTVQVNIGDLLSAANTAVTSAKVVSWAIESQYILKKAEITINVQNLIPGDILVFGYKRVGADALDTYTGDIDIVDVGAVGYFWKP
jgi:hypothetical protein